MQDNFENRIGLKPVDVVAKSCRHIHLLIPVLLIALLTGCGGEPAPAEDRAAVNGVVSLEGEPLKGGTITFVLVEDKRWRVTTSIRADGTFKVQNAPKGPVRVGIETETFAQEKDSYTKIPAVYGNPKTSGLVWDVVAGAPPKTFDLKNKPK